MLHPTWLRPTRTHSQVGGAHSRINCHGLPSLPSPTGSRQLRVDHVSTLMALAVDGETQRAVIKLLAPEYSQIVAENVWAA